MMSVPDIDEMEIDETDETILDLLAEGRCTQGYIVDETEIPRYKVHERLKMYGVAGIARNLHGPTALWELIEDPRDEREGEDD